MGTHPTADALRESARTLGHEADRVRRGGARELAMIESCRLARVAADELDTISRANAELRAALEKCIDLVESVADQQAMPDDSYVRPLNEYRAVLAKLTTTEAKK